MDIAKTAQVALHIPVFTECSAAGCGYSEATDSAKNPDCPTCRGRGQTRVDSIAMLLCRVAWLDHKQQGVFMSMPTGETADVEVQTELSNEALFNTVLRTRGAYVLVDGCALTVKSITLNRVEGLTSLDVRLAMTNPDVLGVQ